MKYFFLCTISRYIYYDIILLISIKDLYQVLLTAEFKGITVLFMIFFHDFVTPKNRNMSEGC